MATHSSVLVWRIPGTVEPGYGVTQSRTRLKRLSSSSPLSAESQPECVVFGDSDLEEVQKLEVVLTRGSRPWDGVFAWYTLQAQHHHCSLFHFKMSVYKGCSGVNLNLVAASCFQSQKHVVADFRFWGSGTDRS